MDSLKTKNPSSESNEDKFHRFLSEFQPDLLRLICFKRGDYHLMSPEEILSDFNYNIIKGKDKIINYRDEKFKEFSFNSFKFLMCTHINKAVGWYHCRARDAKYNSRRSDSQVTTEEGVKSSFEVVCDTLGVEEDMSFDVNDKQKYILSLMHNYSDWLTANEVQIISLMLKGHKQTEIQDILGVTHQAVSFNFKRLKEKVLNRFKIKAFEDCNWKAISEGRKAIEDLFLEKGKNAR
jgi:DNA-binding CsgD family transcriptional regulator